MKAKRLVALANERRAILMVGHLLEYHPAVLRLRELIASGALGELRYVYSNRLNLAKSRREENILLELLRRTTSLSFLNSSAHGPRA